jgi:uncharacterized protein involved in exopolysaccharide biosynthesis
VRQAGTILLNHVAVSPERLSRLVEVEFTSPDPEFSSRVVNAWTSQFVEATLERRFEATSYARNFLEQRLDQLRRRLEESERTLVAYAGQQNIINLPTTSSGENGDTTVERPLVAENLATLNRALNQTEERVKDASHGKVDLETLAFVGFVAGGIYQMFNNHGLPAGVTLLRYAVELVSS